MLCQFNNSMHKLPPIIKFIFYKQDLLSKARMTTPAPSQASAPAPAKLNKIELLSDILAFASVVVGYLFLSHTLRQNYLEEFLGLTLSSGNEIVLFYLLYSLLIVVLKTIAVLIRVVKREETVLSKALESAVGHSLFKVTSIVTLFILSVSSGAERPVGSLCLIAAWLLVAEVNIIFCGLLKGVQVVESVGLFGATIESVVVLGQLASWLFGFDFLTFL